VLKFGAHSEVSEIEHRLVAQAAWWAAQMTVREHLFRSHVD
jgi:hypothetical protein